MISTKIVMQVIAAASLCQALDLERGMDTTWPEDNCCRIYTKNEFKGKKRDFCTDYPDEEKVFDLTDDRKWNNKMMSWKCGRNTAATFCDEADARDCDTDFDFGESAGGGAES